MRNGAGYGGVKGCGVVQIAVARKCAVCAVLLRFYLHHLRFKRARLSAFKAGFIPAFLWVLLLEIIGDVDDLAADLDVVMCQIGFGDVGVAIDAVIGDEAQAAARYPLGALDPKALIHTDDMDFAVERLNAAAVNEDDGAIRDGWLHAVATGEDGGEACWRQAAVVYPVFTEGEVFDRGGCAFSKRAMPGAGFDFVGRDVVVLVVGCFLGSRLFG